MQNLWFILRANFDLFALDSRESEWEVEDVLARPSLVCLCASEPATISFPANERTFFYHITPCFYTLIYHTFVSFCQLFIFVLHFGLFNFAVCCLLACLKKGKCKSNAPLFPFVLGLRESAAISVFCKFDSFLFQTKEKTTVFSTLLLNLI